jgi:hypothetical protein
VNPSGGYINHWADQMTRELAAWAIKDALWGISNLMHSFGEATEPDFVSVIPVYNRVLAVSLLVMAAVIAFGIVERILGGEHGIGLSVVPRVLGCTFFAYTGLAIVRYASTQAALLGHIWDRELSLASPNAVATATHVDISQVHVNVVALIFMAVLISFLALVVYLELIVRAALILTLAVFVPLVCVLAIWPRMAGGALHLAEFIVGLLLAKFVVATAFVVGLSLLLPGVLGVAPKNGKADWMAAGFAVLLITALAPVALFQGIKFAHGTAGKVARDVGSMAVGMTPFGALTRVVPLAALPLAAAAKARASKFLKPALGRLRSHLPSRLRFRQ